MSDWYFPSVAVAGEPMTRAGPLIGTAAATFCESVVVTGAA